MMSRSLARSGLMSGLMALALALGGCAALPSASPTVNQVLKPLKSGEVEVIDIAPDTVSGESAVHAPLSAWTIGDALGGSEGIAPGDRLAVTVYEVGYTLFGKGASADESDGGTGGSARNFPAIIVPDDGMIQFPYAGTLNVAGLSADQVSGAIERRLRGKSQFAQVLVSVDSGPRRSVLMIGDVTKPGRVPLTAARERLLDAIAIASGPQPRKADTLVRLTRGADSSEARLDEIATISPENVILAPGDRVELLRNTRTLTVLGAARSVAEVPFDSAHLTLGEALARSGGPQDDKADATGVFIFRYEWRTREGQPVQQPVIYRLNLLDPHSYFAAQRFEMREKDVMLVANARSNQLGKFIQMLNALTAPVVTVDLLTRP